MVQKAESKRCCLAAASVWTVTEVNGSKMVDMVGMIYKFVYHAISCPPCFWPYHSSEFHLPNCGLTAAKGLCGCAEYGCVQNHCLLTDNTAVPCGSF